MKNIKIFISIILLAFVTSSCQEDFLETAPTNMLEEGDMFETVEGAYTALNGMYRYMYYFDPVYGNHDAFGHMALNLEMEMLGEHMVGHVLAHGWFGQQYAWRTHRNADAGMTQLRWLNYYTIILNANMILENIFEIEDIPEADMNYIASQALGARAFGYYQLAQLYAPAYHVDPNAPAVPIYTEVGQEGHPRATLEEVYTLIETDLADAIEMATGQQSHSSHISLGVLHGLAARAALSKGEWENAIQHADHAIANSGATLFTIEDHPDPFDMSEFDGTWGQYLAQWMRNQLFNNTGASEWMWGMEINEEQATIFASFFSHMDPTEFGYAQLSNQKLISHDETGLFHQMSETDVRRNFYVAPGEGGGPMVDYAQVKFITQRQGSWEADYVFMRLAEMYLIKAEAQARAGMDADAAETLLALMENRDPEYELSQNTGDDLIEEIMFHRAVELWGEGFRFIDLKRTGSDLDRNDKGHNIALAVTMFEEADDDRWMWLIPTDEINANDAISSADQNP